MHENLWAKNVFDEWKMFHGYDKEKSIEYFSENIDFIKDFVDMLSFFYFASCKERWQPYILQPSTSFFSFNFFFLVFVFTKRFTC
jgi:hypothetical protein